MPSRNLGMSLLIVISTCATALAQGQVPATTIQLPTFNATTVNTTVNVPDGGSALLGGIKRASTGSVERGVPILGKIPLANRLFKNRGIGQSRSSALMRVKARIIIQEEEEQKLLNQAYQNRAARGDRRTLEELIALDQADALIKQQAAARIRLEQQKADFLSRHIDRQQSRLEPREKPKPQIPDVEEIRRRNEAARQKRDAEAVAFFAKGQAAQAAGKDGVARIYFNMALRRANNEFKQEIQTHLDTLSGNHK